MTDFSEDYTEESRIVYKDNSWQVEKKKIWLTWNPIKGQWLTKNTETVFEDIKTWHPNGLHKKLTNKILLKRDGFNPDTFRTVFAWFLIDVTVEADFRNPNEYVSECNGMFFVHYLDHKVTFPLAFRQEEPRITFGKERKVTEAEAKQLIKEGVVTMSDFGKGGYVKELTN